MNGGDEIYGGDGNDELRGGGGRDMLFGGDGDDILNGGANRDTLDGGTGNDFLIGGSSIDTFIFRETSDHDTISKFRSNDLLDFSEFGPGVDWSDISIDGSGVLTVAGVADFSITFINTNYVPQENDFIFA